MKGICHKCGEDKSLIRHHLNYNTEETITVCLSCHQKIHRKAKKEGRCKLNHSEVKRLTRLSNHKYSYRKKSFYTSLAPDVKLTEMIMSNQSTGSVTVCSWFATGHGKEILYIDQAEIQEV